MGQGIMQPAFSSGELSPGLYSRVDLAKYHVGAALLRNWFVRVTGGASTRPGTIYIGECKISSKAVRLIPFQFNVLQAYALEFGDQYMRVIKDGAYVTEAPLNITGITQGIPAVMSATAHGFSAGDDVYISGVLGMTQINGKTAQVGSVLTPDSFTLVNQDGSNLDASAFDAYTSGGTVARIYTLATPYLAEDLRLLKYVQSNDVLTLTHPNYAPADMNRLAHNNWTLTTITFVPTIAAPASITALPSTAGTTKYNYVATAISASGEESRASSVVTANGVQMSSTSGAYVYVEAASVTGAVQYNFYRQREVPAGTAGTGELYGYIGTSTSPSLSDVNISPDFTRTPPIGKDPFAGSNYPGCVSYIQQRKVFGGSTAQPESFWMSRSGNYKNMDTSIISQDDDAIEATLAAQEVNTIQFFVPLNGLLALTESSAWLISGGSPEAAITPTTVKGLPQAYNGCNRYVRPLVINYDILYVQSKGSVVRDLNYNFYVNLFTGADVTVLSNHLFTGHEIMDWAWAEEPFKTVWVVRDDGQLLSFLYLKEQDQYSWAHHDTDGMFRSICSISEGQENAVYMVVERNINGRFVKYVERFASRIIQGDVTRAWCVDAGLSYPLTYLNATITPSALSGDSIILTTDNPVFDAGMIGNHIKMSQGKLVITAFNTTTSVIAQSIRPLKTLWPVASGDWSCTAPVTLIRGLDHLEGKTVAILADGSVHDSLVVTNGQIELIQPATDIVVGLPYVCQIQTLPIDVGEPTIQNKKKKITAVNAKVEESRGLRYGHTLDTLFEAKQRTFQPYGNPIELITDLERIILDPLWENTGQIYIQQSYPLPATVLGLIPELTVGT